jgi:A/G-specific adenine glycosylase
VPSPFSAAFVRRILAWYKIHHRKLPWRRTRDPYRIWISEVMLQQTTVEAVLPYYRRWMKQFPDLKILARAPLSRVLKSWQGLGYYQRARNIRATARRIVRDYSGRMPQSYEGLAGLPGVGPYTAAAVLSLAYGSAMPVVEANVRRAMMRLLRLRGRASAGLDKKLAGQLKKIIPFRQAGLFNQALMELGALVCRPASPRCLICPVALFCLAYERGEQEVIPQPRKREIRRLTAVVAVIRRDGKVLIQRRPEKGLLAGLWEFPGGKLRPGETPQQALRREIKEELGIVVKNMTFLTSVKHAYTKYVVDLHAFLAEPVQKPRLSGRRRWVRPAELRRYPFPSGSARIVDRLDELDRPPAREGRASGRAYRNL